MLDEEAVYSVGFLQLLVGSPLHNLALGDDGYHVGLLDGAQAMGNHQHRSVLAHLV